MCFSDQYYFMSTVHAWGMLLMMWGLTIHIRAEFNMFADQMLLVLVTVIWILVRLFKKLCKWIADRCKLWKRKNQEGTLDDDVAAKLALGEGDDADLEAARLELQAMNSDRFRHRFLERSRPWVLQHLVELLTPRTLKMPGPDGRPNIEFIRDVYADLMNMGEGARRPGDRSDISSDEEDELEQQRRSWPKGPIGKRNEEILRFWLSKARLRRNLARLVQGYIDLAVRDQCDVCGRTEASGAKMKSYLAWGGEDDYHAIDKMIAAYEDAYPEVKGSNYIDAPQWQSFFRSRATFITRCSVCNDKLEQERQQKLVIKPGAGRKARAGDISTDEEEDEVPFEPMVVARSSIEGRIMSKWLLAARRRLGGTFPRPDAREQMETYAQRMRAKRLRAKQTSDAAARGGGGGTSGNSSAIPGLPGVQAIVQLNAASKAIAILWIRKARDSLIQSSHEEVERIMNAVLDCLKQMPETEDWYYGADNRMKGNQIVEDGKDLLEFRRRTEMETSIDITKLEDEYGALVEEKTFAMKAELDDLESRIESDKKQLDGMLLAKETTLEGTKRAKARQLAADSKGADNETRRALHSSYKKEIDELVNAFDTEKREKEDEHDRRAAQLNEELRRQQKMRHRGLANKQLDLQEKVMNLNRAMAASILKKESQWIAAASGWIAVSQRKIDVKQQEDKDAANQAKKRAKKR